VRNVATAAEWACAAVKFSALGLVVLGRIDKGKAREKTSQVQPQVALGGGMAAAMPGPVHARGDQLHGGRVHQVNGALELAGKSVSGSAADQAR